MLITYVPTWEGWLYPATVIDCYSKKVIAHAMDDHYRTPLITTAIRRAAATGLADQATFNTDRASNYTSTEFHTALTDLGLRHSTGRTRGRSDPHWVQRSQGLGTERARVRHGRVRPGPARADGSDAPWRLSLGADTYRGLHDAYLRRLELLEASRDLALSVTDDHQASHRSGQPQQADPLR